MLVFREKEQYNEEDLYDTFTVILNKPSNKGLGLSIVGKRNDVGVFVSDVVSVVNRFTHVHAHTPLFVCFYSRTETT